jgi:hypothetical protein
LAKPCRKWFSMLLQGLSSCPILVAVTHVYSLCVSVQDYVCLSKTPVTKWILVSIVNSPDGLSGWCPRVLDSDSRDWGGCVQLATFPCGLLAD